MDEPAPSLPLAERLGRWLEARLDQSVEPRRATARLYGLEIVDLDGLDPLDPMAVRTTFVVEAVDEAAVLAGDGARAAAALFDAVATVQWAWVPEPRQPRPGRFPQRRQARSVTVVLHDDLADRRERSA